jgi:hypothetical protein
LINLWTGSVPNKGTVEMISYYFQGLASEEESLAHIENQKQAASKHKFWPQKPAFPGRKRVLCGQPQAWITQAYLTLRVMRLR